MLAATIQRQQAFALTDMSVASDQLMQRIGVFMFGHMMSVRSNLSDYMASLVVKTAHNEDMAERVRVITNTVRNYFEHYMASMSYKFIVHVVMSENVSPGFRLAYKTYDNLNRDLTVDVTVANENLFCIASIFMFGQTPKIIN